VVAASLAPEQDGRASVLERGIAARPAAGESESGDRALAVEGEGRVLLGVIDGLGHGREAAAAAGAAATVVETHVAEPPDHLLGRCHEALLGTRGAVITLAAVDLEAATLSWSGVGDVVGLLVRGGRGADTHHAFAPVRAGIVGLHMSVVRSAVVPLEPDDLIVLASDGVRLPFDLEYVSRDSMQTVADRLLADHGLAADDATVLVAKYGGVPA